MAVRYRTEITGWNPHLRETNVYRLDIEDINYNGDVSMLDTGSTTISLDVQNNELIAFPAVSPSFLNISLIATEEFSLVNLFTENERNLPVTLYKDGNVFGKYIIIPSNTKEPFIDPPFPVSITAVDGLDLLSKHEYTNITGQASILTVFKRCLDKLGLNLNINTFNTIQYQGMTVGGDVFAETIINQERFEGKDCGEVLNELMKEWVSGIFQVNGEWFIIRYPDYLKASGSVTFNSYDYELNPLSPLTIDPDLTLGAKVGDIIHANNDQMRSMNLAYKQVAIRYEYGYFKNMFSPFTANFSGNVTDFFGWQKVGGVIASPAFVNPYATISGRYHPDQFISLANVVPVGNQSKVRFELTFNAGNANAVVFRVVYTKGAVTLWWNDYQQLWTDEAVVLSGFADERTWDNGGRSTGLGNTVKGSIDIPLESDVVSDFNGGFLNIHILPSWFRASNVNDSDPGELKLYNASLSFVTTDQDIIAETHRVINNGDYSQIPDTIEVSTGESQFSGYLGTMFKANGVDPTNGFSNDGGLTYEKFLDLAAKDILFQHGKPMSVYEGSVLGSFNLLSRININNLNGIFIPMRLTYDFRNSVIDTALIETNTVDVPHQVLSTTFELESPQTPATGGGFDV